MSIVTFRMRLIRKFFVFKGGSMGILRFMALFAFVAVSVLAVVGPTAAQDEVDAVAVVEQFLPEGVTAVAAAKDDLLAAVNQALAANPDNVADIVKQIGALRPDAMDDIVNAALNAAPDQAGAINQAAQRIRLQSAPVTKQKRDEPSPVRP